MFPVPSLEHLLALKLHAIKSASDRRGYKDLLDVISLTEINKIDLGSDNFKALCDKYGNARIYE